MTAGICPRCPRTCSTDFRCGWMVADCHDLSTRPDRQSLTGSAEPVRPDAGRHVPAHLLDLVLNLDAGRPSMRRSLMLARATRAVAELRGVEVAEWADLRRAAHLTGVTLAGQTDHPAIRRGAGRPAGAREVRGTDTSVSAWSGGHRGDRRHQGSDPGPPGQRCRPPGNRAGRTGRASARGSSGSSAGATLAALGSSRRSGNPSGKRHHRRTPAQHRPARSGRRADVDPCPVTDPVGVGRQ